MFFESLEKRRVFSMGALGVFDVSLGQTTPFWPEQPDHNGAYSAITFQGGSEPHLFLNGYWDFEPLQATTVTNGVAVFVPGSITINLAGDEVMVYNYDEAGEVTTTQHQYPVYTASGGPRFTSVHDVSTSTSASIEASGGVTFVPQAWRLSWERPDVGITFTGSGDGQSRSIAEPAEFLYTGNPGTSITVRVTRTAPLKDQPFVIPLLRSGNVSNADIMQAPPQSVTIPANEDAVEFTVTAREDDRTESTTVPGNPDGCAQCQQPTVQPWENLILSLGNGVFDPVSEVFSKVEIKVEDDRKNRYSDWYWKRQPIREGENGILGTHTKYEYVYPEPDVLGNDIPGSGVWHKSITTYRARYEWRNVRALNTGTNPGEGYSGSVSFERSQTEEISFTTGVEFPVSHAGTTIATLQFSVAKSLSVTAGMQTNMQIVADADEDEKIKVLLFDRVRVIDKMRITFQGEGSPDSNPDAIQWDPDGFYGWDHVADDYLEVVWGTIAVRQTSIDQEAADEHFPHAAIQEADLNDLLGRIQWPPYGGEGD
jgi:hypothetical protein